MNKIGFKFSWEKQKRPRKTKVIEEIPMIIPGTSIAHITEISMKIEDMEKFMITSSFSRLNKIQKQQYINSYKFLVTTLALINIPSVGNITECSNLDVNGWM